jgi:WD40 repeat protein
MNPQEFEALSSIYEFVFEKIRPKHYQPFDELDMAIMLLKDLLNLEFDRIHVQYGIQSDEPIHASLTFVTNALSKLSYAVKAAEDAITESNDEKKRAFLDQADSLKSQSRMDFNAAHNEAIKAFLQSHNFDRQALATKIRIITTLHLNNYFNLISRSMNMSLIEEFVTTAWDEFIRLPLVKQSIYNEFEGSMIRNGFLLVMGDREARKHVLVEISRIRALIGEVIVAYLPIPGTKEQEIDISSITNASLSGHNDFVQTLTVFGSRLYSGSADNTIKVWDLSEDPLPVFSLGTLYGHNNEVVCLLAKQGRLFSGSKDHTVKVWDISSESLPSYPIATLVGHSFSVYALAIDGEEGGGRTRLFTGSGDKTIKVWAVDMKSEAIDSGAIATLTGHEHDINALVTHKGRLFSGSLKTIKVWDIRSDPLPSAPILSLSCHKDWVNTLLISEDRLFSGSTDAINVWDLSHGDEIPSSPMGTLHDEGYDVNKLIIAGGRLYSGIGAQDTSVVIWDIASDRAHAQPIGTVKGDKGTIFALVVSGGRLCTGSNQEKITVRWV